MNTAVWRNPYKDLICTKPEYILVCPDEKLSADSEIYLSQKISEYKKIYVDLGSGSGAFLLSLCRQEPQALCIGVELRFKRIYRNAEKAEKIGLNNLLLIHTRAQNLADFFSAASLDGVYINFPDPWDKRHWLKNRLLNSEFLLKLSKLLKPGGFISYKTDHREYFEKTLLAIQANANFVLERTSFDLAASDYDNGNIRSEFEILFRSKGMPVYYLLARKEFTSV